MDYQIDPYQAKPLPDEFSRGHQNRLSGLNGFQRGQDLVEYLRSTLARHHRHATRLPIAKLLALSCDMPWSEYQAKHTFLPLFSCCAQEQSFTSGGDLLEGTVRYGGCLAPRAQAHFCMACAEEDQNKYHYSYWHRAHQMPGQFWCSVHQGELLHVAPMATDYDRDARYWTDRSLVSKRNTLGIDREHPGIQRFYRISEHLLGMDLKRRRSFVLSALQSRAVAIGVTRAKCATKARHMPSLSDLARKRLPLPFLKELFPTIESRSMERTFFPIDGALMSGDGPRPGTAIALAATVLFDDPDSAIAAISATTNTDTSFVRNRNGNQLAGVIRGCDGSIDQIALELRLSVQKADELILKRRTAIIRSVSDTPEGDALRDLFDGLSLSESCVRHSVSREHLEFLLRLKLRRTKIAQ